MQVHDELVFDLHKDEVDVVKENIKQLNQSMANEPTADEDVAFAFGLDDYAPDRASVTALGGGRTDDVGPP